MGAYALIHEMGLEDYYALRSSPRGEFVGGSDQNLASLEDLEAAGVAVQHLPGGFDCVRLNVDGVHCAACSWLIERMQPSIHGLHSARVRLSDNSVELIYDPNQTNVSRIAKRFTGLGYGLSPWNEDPEFDAEVIQKQRTHWYRIAIAAFIAANSMWIGVALYAGESTGISKENETFLRWLGALLGLLAAAIPGRSIFQTAWHAILNRTPHVDIPVALALSIGTLGSIIGAASGYGHIYFDSLASLILLLLIGRYVQFRAQSKARTAVGRLMRWNTPIAKRVAPDGTTLAIPAERLKPGDIVRVEPGETIPADGTVQSGSSHLDTSLLTGETIPVSVKPLDRVVGGTSNLSARIEVNVTAAGSESRVGKLMAMVRDATTYRTPWIQAADRVGKWFVIVVLTLALLTWIGWTLRSGMGVATQHTMALLTIACPCALALAAPLVITIALGRNAKRHIWIREGDALERLATPGMLWLDKTGTLTLGKIHIHEWIGDEKWIPWAAAAELSIQHPIAAAIVRFADAYEFDPGDFQVTETQQRTGYGTTSRVNGSLVAIGNAPWMTELKIPIEGKFLQEADRIRGKGQSPIFIGVDQQLVGIVAAGDALRPDAVGTLQKIQSLGWKLGILSGDSPSVVEALTKSLAEQGVTFEAALGEKSPEEKLAVIQANREKNQGPVVQGPIVMVGDGVNDAAALAAADVGIAIRGNSDQSLAVAPIYIANPRISSVLELFEGAKNVVQGIRRCFIASLLYNTFTISLAVCGLIHPLIAALFMPLSGITVLAMAVRKR